ncbi:hypothetical protein GQ651_04170 [Alphaproteobacteria bacterium GH1-50]|uniref:Ferrochelatase n=1 Tax=Kangsaoukella pontilimi TaxID=2691042 RepID=A0A7C9MYV7_9RHOB|nr:hypothetical protein [Kangsaoukella pontilimi]MXQ07038.1 hypothetical protein [Kangsaoukella pontilimi]
MKTRIIGTTFAALLVASSAFAGGLDAPIMEAEPEVMDETIVVEEATSGSQQFVIPLMLLAIIAAVASD